MPRRGGRAWVNRLWSGAELSGKDTWKASLFLRCCRRSRSRARSRSSSSSLSKARMCSSKQISASSLSMSNHRRLSGHHTSETPPHSPATPLLQGCCPCRDQGQPGWWGKVDRGLCGRSYWIVVLEVSFINCMRKN